jgi:hypothetical protein
MASIRSSCARKRCCRSSSRISSSSKSIVRSIERAACRVTQMTGPDLVQLTQASANVKFVETGAHAMALQVIDTFPWLAALHANAASHMNVRGNAAMAAAVAGSLLRRPTRSRQVPRQNRSSPGATVQPAAGYQSIGPVTEQQSACDFARQPRRQFPERVPPYGDRWSRRA